MGENTFDRNISTLQFQMRLLFMATSVDNIPGIEKLNYLNIVFKNLVEFNSIRLPEVREIDEYEIIKGKEFEILNTCVKMISDNRLSDHVFNDIMYQNPIEIDLSQCETMISTNFRDAEPYIDDSSVYLLIENTVKTFDYPDIGFGEEFHFIKLPDELVSFGKDICEPMRIAARNYASVKGLNNVNCMVMIRFVRDESLEFIYKSKNQKEYMESLSTIIDTKKSNVMSQAFVFDFCCAPSSKCYDYKKQELYSNLRPFGVPDPSLLGLDIIYKKVSTGYAEKRFPEFKGYTFSKDCTVYDVLNWKDTINQTSDVVIRTPYYSYENVTSFISGIANDPNIRTIFMTLYRVSGNSVIVDSLCEAASSGKSVYVYIELMARGDEEQNISLYKKLMKAGVHICNHHKDYLKVHMKAFLAITNEGETYSMISTGNFNEKTANIYTDMSYLTKNINVGIELMTIFKYLFGMIRDVPSTNHYVITKDIRKYIIDRINEQIDLEEKGFIMMKVNHLCDTEIVNALNNAATSNVKIYILVRTSFDYAILNYSEWKRYPNIKIKSRVGRFLEHDRVFIFGEDCYIGSCDMLQRNLDKRTELLFRVPSNIQSDLIRRSFIEMFDNKACFYDESNPSVNFRIKLDGETSDC